MLHLIEQKQKAHPFSWGAYRNETDDPFWEEFQTYEKSLRLSPGTAPQREGERKGTPVYRRCSKVGNNVAAKAAGSPPLAGGAGGGVGDARNQTSVFAERTPPLTPPARGGEQAAPASTFSLLSETRGIYRLKSAFTRLCAAIRERGPETAARLREQISSAEFWLGVVFGAVTRIATKIAILDVFPDKPGLAALTGFVACAGAGLAAGIVAFLVRTRYRNEHRPQGAARAPYIGRALWESAWIGLFGGLIGGYVTNAGAVIAEAGGFTVGASAGVAVGMIHSAARAIREARGQKVKISWGKLALNSLLFGSVGGVLGLTLHEVLGAGPSLASPIPVGESGGVIYVPHRAPVPYNLGNCATSPCGGPPPVEAAPVVHTAPLPPPAAVHDVAPPPPEHAPAMAEHHQPAHRTLHKKVPHKIHHHHPKAKVPAQPLPEKSENPCGPVKETPPHKTVHHPAKAAHRPKLHHVHKAIPKPQPKPLVFERPPLRQPTAFGPPVLEAPPEGLALKGPPIIQTPPNPCANGLCDRPPCVETARLNVVGPCADPGAHCVEKIHFNAQGEATRAVLEPQTVKPGAVAATKPYFQIEATQASREARWQGAVRGEVVKPKPEDLKVTLVLPLKDHALAPMGPTPV